MSVNKVPVLFETVPVLMWITIRNYIFNLSENNYQSRKKLTIWILEISFKAIATRKIFNKMSMFYEILVLNIKGTNQAKRFEMHELNPFKNHFSRLLKFNILNQKITKNLLNNMMICFCLFVFPVFASSYKFFETKICSDLQKNSRRRRTIIKTFYCFNVMPDWLQFCCYIFLTLFFQQKKQRFQLLLTHTLPFMLKTNSKLNF